VTSSITQKRIFSEHSPQNGQAGNQVKSIALQRHKPYDYGGNIENLYVSHHGVDIKGNGEEDKLKARDGVADETLALARFLPELRRFRMLKQKKVSEETLVEILDHQRDLKMFAIEMHEGDQDARFMQSIAGLNQLEWLELKHLFTLDATQVNAIGPLPSLVRLELDNRSAQSEALDFLKANLSIRKTT